MIDIARTEGTTEGREKTEREVGGKEGATEDSPPPPPEDKEERGVEETEEDKEEREGGKEARPESEKGKRRPVRDNEEATDT